MNTKQKVLIVDDEEMIRWSLGEALRNWGYEPVEAATGTRALELLGTETPAAVLLDINLPDSFGLDLLREIKLRAPQTAVIMVSAEAYFENAVSALRGGADDFIGKPVNLNELQYALHEKLQGPAKQESAAPAVPPRVLILSESWERLTSLDLLLRNQEIQITNANYPGELDVARAGRYDLVVIDVAPAFVPDLLAELRARPEYADIPILVENSRLMTDERLAGVLPKYRAMPCNQAELVALVRRRLDSPTKQYEVARLL